MNSIDKYLLHLHEGPLFNYFRYTVKERDQIRECLDKCSELKKDKAKCRAKCIAPRPTKKEVKYDDYARRLEGFSEWTNCNRLKSKKKEMDKLIKQSLKFREKCNKDEDTRKVFVCRTYHNSRLEAFEKHKKEIDVEMKKLNC